MSANYHPRENARRAEIENHLIPYEGIPASSFEIVVEPKKLKKPSPIPIYAIGIMPTGVEDYRRITASSPNKDKVVGLAETILAERGHTIERKVKDNHAP